ncbi:MAG: carboxymuconolactone decarboxylase family protein [Rhodospirillales bacterium]|nr:carboxymuconolactone decarboxylase family protein [Rhodospirillales bacterium]
MSEFDVHTTGTAPAESVETLEKIIEKFGFLPNLLGVMAESPAALKGYASLSGLVEQSSFAPDEQQMMLLTVSRINGCHYCVAAHTLGGKRAGLDEAVIDAIRNDQAIADPRKAALYAFTKAMVEKRGWVNDDLGAFLGAGFSKAQALEVVLATAMKTLSNYINHIAETPLNEPMKTAAWSGPKAA